MVSIYQEKSVDEGDELTPTMAIVLYSNSLKNVVCATEHSVKPDNSLSIGTVISSDSLIGKITRLKSNNERRVSELILPNNILLDTTKYLIWHKRRCIKDMWFRRENKSVVTCLRVEWTPLLFCVNKLNHQFSILALGTDSRPQLKTRLYHAPLMNIDSSGKLCMGTASIPHEVDSLALSNCEDALFNSQFTHVSHNKTLKHGAGNDSHFLFWESKSSKRKQPHRVKACELAPYLNFGEFLEGLH